MERVAHGEMHRGTIHGRLRLLLTIALLIGVMVGGSTVWLIGGATSANAQNATPVATPVAVPGQQLVAISCPAGFDLFVRSELFFGTTLPDGTGSVNEDWQRFLDTEITPRFPDGLTVLTGYGQWRNSQNVITKEGSIVLIILYPVSDAQASSAKLDEIREAYKTQFNQESVLRADDAIPVCTSF